MASRQFHAQNVYAVVMRVLARFEFAMGRRLSWGFGSHHLHIAPHAFAQANAYYSRDCQGLYLGYFVGPRGNTVYNCLSHDVIAHEVTHALVDGLRCNYVRPSHPDQAGFHEGFADIVALLSVFGLRDVVEMLLPGAERGAERISIERLTPEALRDCALMGLAEQFGRETTNLRESALRRAGAGEPDAGLLESEACLEPHNRGEVLTAAVLNAFIAIWHRRLQQGWPESGLVPRERVAEEGAEAAEQLLTMAIRAMDYAPVVDVSFRDFLSALLTSDRELLPDDGKYKYRDELRRTFAEWGIEPASERPRSGDTGLKEEAGAWAKPTKQGAIRCDCVHRESLERDPDEVFRFLWENRKTLEVFEDAYTRVESVRPCVRVGPDGFVLHETVSEYIQMIDMPAGDLHKKPLNMTRPRSMPHDTPVRIYGGGVLVFDEFGRLKYHIHKRIDNARRQSERLRYLWESGIRDSQGRYGFSDGAPRGQRFALAHLQRMGRLPEEEVWHV